MSDRSDTGRWYRLHHGFENNLEETRTSKFFKDYQNNMSPKDEHSLRSLKNSRVRVFFKLHEKQCYYQLIMYMKNVVQCQNKGNSV